MQIAVYGCLPALGVLAITGIQLWAAKMEIFSWTSEQTKKKFHFLDDDLFERTTVLAANQGLYNLLLAAGLVWSLFIGDLVWAAKIAAFFLALVWIAGVFGTWSARGGARVFWLPILGQTATSTVALALLLSDWPSGS